MTPIAPVLEEMLPKSAVLQMQGRPYEAQRAYSEEKGIKRPEPTNADIDRLAIALELEKLIDS